MTMSRNKRCKPRIRSDTVNRRKIENKKVKNAKHQIIDGIEFKSNLEAYCYQALKETKIPFEYEPHSYVLIPPFQYNDEKVRAAKYKPDFVGDNWLIETKGFETDAFKLRWKLFKKYLHDNELTLKLFLPRNRVQVMEAIEAIKNI